MAATILVSILALAIAFFATLLATKHWIRIAKANLLIGHDMNKYEKPAVAEGGGIAVISGFGLAILIYIFFKTFYLKDTTHLIEAFALLVTILLAGFIGFIDDILGWKKGLRRWQKFAMTIPIAIPLVVIAAGHAEMIVPFIGSVNFGLLYPLLLVPLGIIGAANAFNILAGFNGLEAGMGSLILAGLGIVCLVTGQPWLALIAFSAVVALLAFLLYNKFPAKIFPGDSMTYAIGALIACIAIIGNMEKAAVFMFIPYFIEAALKVRGKLKFESFGKPRKDGSLDLRYPKFYSLTHTAIWLLKKIKPSHKVYEKEVVKLLLAVEFVIVLAVLISLF